MSNIVDRPENPGTRLSNMVGNPENLSAVRGVARVAMVQRIAFYLRSQNQPLFAWYHRCEPTHYHHGIIVCAPVGYEQIHAHRSLRHLADAFAQAGLPVLRFDYHGTGDSDGIDENPERYATWLANIRDAKRWMQEQLGCHRISMIGLRLGASLAMQLSSEHEVDNLLLWEPVIKGRLYLRELRALSLTAESRPRALPEEPDALEAAGFVISKQTAEELTQLDLLKVRPRCQCVLIVARADRPEDTRLLEHLSALGITASQTIQPGYDEMMAEPHHNQVPWSTIHHMVDWLLAALSPEYLPYYQDAFEKVGPAQAFITPQRYTLYPFDSPRKIQERAVRISQQPDLFGIMSEPMDGGHEHLPTMVLVNAGSAYRVGPNRLYVFLARQLAAQGFRCLRMDLCGLGDSITTDLHSENDPYASTMFRDIDLTIKHLQLHFGTKRVVLMGLCSGAYAAFQSAVQLSNPALVESVLINPLTFYWKNGMSLEASQAKQFERIHYYMKAALQPNKWLRMLSGNTKIGLIGALKTLVQGWRLRSSSPGTNAPNHDRDPSDVGLSAPPQEDMLADLQRVSRAGRQLSCFFARTDPGYSLLNFHTGWNLNKLAQGGKIKVSFIEDADHTFTHRWPRRTVVQAITEYLVQRYQPVRRESR